MATQRDFTQLEKARAATPATQRNESAMRPPVDVFENSDGIRLIADMPGVSKEHLRLQAEGNTLTIEGDLQFEVTDRMEPLHAEVRSTLYRCSFVLSSELDTSQIEAILKDGVLAVRIPKRAAFRPRRIEVQSG